MSIQSKPMLTVVTKNVMTTLTHSQVSEAVDRLHEAMATPDPDNPDLWITEVAGHKVWGILDHGAGPEGQDIFTILYPSDY